VVAGPQATASLELTNTHFSPSHAPAPAR
jgi:hypothetical protein